MSRLRVSVQLAEPSWATLAEQASESRAAAFSFFNTSLLTACLGARLEKEPTATVSHLQHY